MLPIPAYPRRRWPLRLGVTTLLLSLGLTFGYGIPVANRVVDVVSAQEEANRTADANHFWRMVAGVEPLDDSDLGRVAATTQRLGRQHNAIKTLMRYYVGPGELPDLEDRLGFHAFDRPHPDGRDETVSDAGHFTDRFILYAIQAVGAVPDTSVDDLIRPIPDVPSYGWLRWEWGAAALAALLSVCGLFWLWLRRNRRRWPARAEARAVAALSDEQRHVYRIIRGLQREPASDHRDELLKQAKDLFTDMKRGLDTPDQLTSLRHALADAKETWHVKREAYQELPKIEP